MIASLLIANRGEIACRIIRTARALGIRTVAVYSDADANAKHVAVCDEAVHIGGSAPAESYLRWERIIEAAQATGAQAIHPGYGFLSENEAFAQACAKAGLVFIGPPASAIQAMGLKAESKRLMEKAGVPLTHGYDTSDLARQLGLPVVLVVGLRLGCINHALLTAEAIASRGLKLAGWVANTVDPAMAHMDGNIEAIAARISAPLLGHVPRLEHPTAAAAAAYLDLGKVKTDV